MLQCELQHVLQRVTLKTSDPLHLLQGGLQRVLPCMGQCVLQCEMQCVLQRVTLKPSDSLHVLQLALQRMLQCVLQHVAVRVAACVAACEFQGI